VEGLAALFYSRSSRQAGLDLSQISSTNFNNSLASAHGYFLCGKVVSVTDFGLAVRWIRKECLARFAIGAGYDEVPLEGYALG
jgi:hypothetical protein